MLLLLLFIVVAVVVLTIWLLLERKGEEKTQEKPSPVLNVCLSLLLLYIYSDTVNSRPRLSRAISVFSICI